MLGSVRGAILRGRHPELEGKLRSLFQLRAQIARKMLDGPRGADPAAHERLLSKWRTEQDDMEVALTLQIPELRLSRPSMNVELADVSRLLPADSVLIEIVRVTDHGFTWLPEPETGASYVAFVMPAGDAPQVRLVQLGPADLIDAAVLRTFPFGDGHHLDEGLIHETWGMRLRELIFEPLIPHLEDRRRLLISPDGALQFVPFGLLQTDSGEFLIEDYRIDYLSSGRDLLQFTLSPQGSNLPIVVADPDFNLTATQDTTIAGGPFTRSPGFAVEGKWLRWKLGAELWLQHDALKGRVRRIRSPQILHFATHGFVEEPRQNEPRSQKMLAIHQTASTVGNAYPVDNPLLRSGLALAGANTGLSGGASAEDAEDGILTAEDVTALDLLGTELVVLSACDTGRGEVRTGEGVLGLRRSFTVAGARVLVMSLFQVPSGLAFELMREFYTRVVDDPDLSYAEALREAQLSVKQRYPDNPAWGFFICQGDPDLRRTASA